MDSKGIIFIISAPSGAGKTTLCQGLLNSLEGITFSISHTTRKPRKNEKDGVNYFFISDRDFDKMADKEKFVEWAFIYGNRYGTSVQEIERIQGKGKDILLEIDSQGAKQIKQKYPSAVSIFILPPSLKDLARRLKNRATDDIEVFEVRMRKAKEEILEMSCYDYIVINDIFDNALERLRAIVIAERSKKSRMINTLKRFF